MQYSPKPCSYFWHSHHFYPCRVPKIQHTLLFIRTSKKSVDKLQVDYDDEDSRVQHLRHMYLVMWQRDMDHVLPPGEKAQHLPPQSLRRLLGITRQDKVTNTNVLSRAGLPTMYTLLRKRRLRWLGHVYSMEDGRIPKDIQSTKSLPRGREVSQERHEGTIH